MNAALICGRIGGGALIADFGISLARDEPVQKTGWYPKLHCVFEGQFYSEPVAEARAAPPDIHGNVEQATASATHELALREGWGLKMHSANGIFSVRKRVIVLREFWERVSKFFSFMITPRF